MTAVENERFIECCGDDRFEIIKRAREYIICATNIESRPEEMQVLDTFLFRCWQMGWLKNDFHQLEKENAELKKYTEKLSEQHADEWQKQQEVITELKAQTEKIIEIDTAKIFELTTEINSLKAHCKAVDEVNEKMKRCSICKNFIECMDNARLNLPPFENCTENG